MYRILLVEDDSGIAQAICEQGAMWELDVRCVRNFHDVLGEFTAYDPQLVLMDISLPFFNGYHWCSEIRRVSRVPLIFLSSAADNMNIVMAMNMGADDFIAKPFDQRVLMAKVQALLRRCYDFGPSAHLLECRGAVLDAAAGTLTVGQTQLSLSRNEERILQLLMEHKGQIVSREALMIRLWESDSFIDENTLSVNITRLRRKLEAAGLTDFIRTRKGAGYQVTDE